MKNTVITGLLVYFAMSLFIACNPKKTETVAVDTAQIKKDIQAREDQYAELYNSRELKNIGYYSEDAISFSQNKAPLVGKTAIVEYLKSGLVDKDRTDKLSFTTKEVYVSNEGNQVLEIGYYKVTDSTNNTINSGNYMSLFVKKDGKYVCLRDMSCSDRPLE
jgi:ketosteroid isomerase-like protein